MEDGAAVLNGEIIFSVSSLCGESGHGIVAQVPRNVENEARRGTGAGSLIRPSHCSVFQPAEEDETHPPIREELRFPWYQKRGNNTAAAVEQAAKDLKKAMDGSNPYNNVDVATVFMAAANKPVVAREDSVDPNAMSAGEGIANSPSGYLAGAGSGPQNRRFYKNLEKEASLFEDEDLLDASLVEEKLLGWKKMDAEDRLILFRRVQRENRARREEQTGPHNSKHTVFGIKPPCPPTRGLVSPKRKTLPTVHFRKANKCAYGAVREHSLACDARSRRSASATSFASLDSREVGHAHTNATAPSSGPDDSAPDEAQTAALQRSRVLGGYDHLRGDSELRSRSGGSREEGEEWRKG